MCVAYLKSSDFTRQKDITKSEMRRVVERLAALHGDKPVKALQRKHILRWREEMADRPGAANTMLRTVAILMVWAVDHEYRPDNPALRLKKFKAKKFKAWTDAQLYQFEDRWPLGTPQRTGYALALYTAIRRNNLPTLEWGWIVGDKIHVTPSKTEDSTEVPLAIPIHPDLAEALAAINPCHFKFILTGERGHPISPIHFGSMMSDAIKAAGLPTGRQGCVLHGLRKTTTKTLVESGATNSETMAITGHTTDSMLRLYARDARQKGLGEGAMNKWKANKREPKKEV